MPTYSGSLIPNPALESLAANDIQGLMTPGLVPDIARQSAEVAAGRGVAGSPAGASTAVRMSEQDFLTRLGLGNTLLNSQYSRNVPYDITPYQQAGLNQDQQRLDLERQWQQWQMNQRSMPSVSYGGGPHPAPSPAGGGSMAYTPAPTYGGGTSYPSSDPYINPSPGMDYPSGDLLPLYPGGPVAGGGGGDPYGHAPTDPGYGGGGATVNLEDMAWSTPQFDPYAEFENIWASLGSPDMGG